MENFTFRLPVRTLCCMCTRNWTYKELDFDSRQEQKFFTSFAASRPTLGATPYQVSAGIYFSGFKAAGAETEFRLAVTNVRNCSTTACCLGDYAQRQLHINSSGSVCVKEESRSLDTSVYEQRQVGNFTNPSRFTKSPAICLDEARTSVD